MVVTATKAVREPPQLLALAECVDHRDEADVAQAAFVAGLGGVGEGEGFDGEDGDAGFEVMTRTLGGAIAHGESDCARLRIQRRDLRRIAYEGFKDALARPIRRRADAPCSADSASQSQARSYSWMSSSPVSHSSSLIVSTMTSRRS